MTTRFDPELNVVLVRAEIQGPAGSFVLALALDTGATQTLIRTEALITAGYYPADSSESFEVTTASEVVRMPIVTLKSLRCLDRVRHEFPVLCHDLPPTVGIAGVIGLDFLRDYALTINFPKGEIKLTRPRVRKKRPRRGKRPSRG